MNRLLLTTCLLLGAALPASAHFVYVVPDGSSKVSVILSENLEPDGNVSTNVYAGTKLQARGADGKIEDIATKTAEHSLTADIPGRGSRVIFGKAVLGVRSRANAKPFLLSYYPKTILGSVAGDALTLGNVVPVEIVPVGAARQVQFLVLANGKPAATTDVTVLTPSGKSKKVVTDAKGLTEVFDEAGRYGVWARIVSPIAGEQDGKKYEEVRQYPTLVYDAPAFAPLPVPVASMGAIVSDGYLYVYGGHAGKTHTYDTKAVLGTFQRLKLNTPGAKWEELPGGPILQGMNLAAHGGKIYRVGGMSPRNAPGEPSDNHSSSEVVCYNPKSGKWEELPPLPVGRSSHDVVVSGDKLVVVGGWQMRGRSEKSVWQDTALVMDLSSASPKWEAIPQPFRRRALTAAAVGTKVYVLGGLGEKESASRCDILDLATGKWTQGPDFPGGSMMGFSPAATALNGKVVMNTSGGPVYQLNQAGDAWVSIGDAAIRRFVHRMVPLTNDSVVLVGGASRSLGNVAELEIVKLTTPKKAEK